MAVLIAALIIVPLLELWVIIQIGGVIGALPTIVLLLSFSLGGAWLVRNQGRAAWDRFSRAMAAGRIPAKETADGALIILAGALLLTPGFLTDLIGILLLLPPIRATIRTVGTARLLGGGWRGVAFTAATGAHGSWTRRGAAGSAGRAEDAGGSAGTRPTARRDYDVEGTAVDADTPALDS